MSARITLHCDQMWKYGSCTSQLFTDATTITEARAVADQCGWRVGPGGDYCPGCSGRPTAEKTTVVLLHQPR